MNKKSIIGLYVLLVVAIGMLFQISYNQHITCGGDPLFNVSYLKGMEQKAFDKAGRGRGGYDGKREERYKRQYLNLAQRDVSEFFKKDISLDKPHMTNPYVLAWVTLAISDTLTFGFNDYEGRFGMASDYFTDDGWQSFASSLKRSRIVEMMEKNQQLITAAPRGAPVIQSQGEVDGAYQWVIETPMAWTYRSGAKTSNQRLLVTVIIRRSDNEKHPYGIAIDQFIAIVR